LTTGCTDCEDTKSPISHINFHGHKYDKAKGLEIDYFIDSSLYDGGYPISIISDTTIYIFSDSTGFDTLAFSYKRYIEFESRDCGFTIILDSMKLLDMSTFDSVLFTIEDSSYHYPFYSRQNTYRIEIYN
jgi:hypothetical protein